MASAPKDLWVEVYEAWSAEERAAFKTEMEVGVADATASANAGNFEEAWGTLGPISGQLKPLMAQPEWPELQSHYASAMTVQQQVYFILGKPSDRPVLPAQQATGGHVGASDMSFDEADKAELARIDAMTNDADKLAALEAHSLVVTLRDTDAHTFKEDQAERFVRQHQYFGSNYFVVRVLWDGSCFPQSMLHIIGSLAGLNYREWFDIPADCGFAFRKKVVQFLEDNKHKTVMYKIAGVPLVEVSLRQLTYIDTDAKEDFNKALDRLKLPSSNMCDGCMAAVALIPGPEDHRPWQPHGRPQNYLSPEDPSRR